MCLYMSRIFIHITHNELHTCIYRLKLMGQCQVLLFRDLHANITDHFLFINLLIFLQDVKCECSPDSSAGEKVKF